MPDQRRHRGAHPEDAKLFAPHLWAQLRAATADLSWLLSRRYATPSSLKLVGDRYELTERQRTAVMRAACSDSAAASRLSRQVDVAEAQGLELWIDGYNVLTTIETALAGGVVLGCRDGTYRDMASVHGTYRKVEETPPALSLLGDYLAAAKVGQCVWYLDSPVSNSGRLRQLMLRIAEGCGWNWRVVLVLDPDALLGADTGNIIASADSAILDHCGHWVNLARCVVERISSPWVVDLS